MKITYNWLKEYIDTGLTPEELHKKFFTLGIGIETFAPLYTDINKVLIGQILEVQKHPNADKLTVCTVATGTEKLVIVCGAKNHKAGDKAALAVNGATLPGGLTIKKVELRGIESNGMLCSEKELGLADSSAGIMILPPEAPLGKDFKETYGLNDWLYDIEVMPNKPEYLGIIGIARVLSAALKKPMKLSETGFNEEKALKTADIVKVKIEDKELCPRYTSRYLAGVKLGPSPVAVQVRLRSVGIRAINNIVDATNYALIETGHPLHAFDAELTAGRTIIVRRAKNGEEITTLDGIKRKLDKDILVIADPEKAIALAGIMGGRVSEINNNTVNVILESAYFAPVAIRKTSKKLGLMTEASYRFERGTDYDGIINALNRTTRLIAQFSGGKIASGYIDVYPEKLKQESITTRYERVNKILGTKIPGQEMLDISKSLGFRATGQDDKAFTVTVPSFRVDVTREIDMVEEIAVIYGYDKIPERFPRIELAQVSALSGLEERVKASLINRGLNEIITFTFMDKAWFDKAEISADNPIRTGSVPLVNHLIENWNTLRSTLLPNMLNAVALNAVSHGNKDLKFIETGKVFSKTGKDYLEHNALGILVSGAAGPSSWLQEPKEGGFFFLKGLLEGLFGDLNVNYILKDGSNDFFDPACAIKILCGNEQIGIAGEVKRKILKLPDIKERVYFAEIDLQILQNKIGPKKSFLQLPKFPANSRDISFIVDTGLNAGEILSFIRETGHSNLVNVEIIDLYLGDKVEKGKKSITYSLTYRNPAKTLTDGEVDSINKDIIQKVLKMFNAQIRL